MYGTKNANHPHTDGSRGTPDFHRNRQAGGTRSAKATHRLYRAANELARRATLNVHTMRAAVVDADGLTHRTIAGDLTDQPDAWTQFAGWSADGAIAIIARGWESPENAKWEEENKTFRHTKEGWLLDSYLVNLATGKAKNVTAVDRVSFYNGGLFFWPNDATKLGFTR